MRRFWRQLLALLILSGPLSGCATYGLWSGRLWVGQADPWPRQEASAVGVMQTAAPWRAAEVLHAERAQDDTWHAWIRYTRREGQGERVVYVSAPQERLRRGRTSPDRLIWDVTCPTFGEATGRLTGPEHGVAGVWLTGRVDDQVVVGPRGDGSSYEDLWIRQRQVGLPRAPGTTRFDWRLLPTLLLTPLAAGWDLTSWPVQLFVWPGLAVTLI